MTLSVYLTFDGNCREAFEFYRSVFGGEFAMLSTFADGPEDLDPQAAGADRIMHVGLPVGASVLMGSDRPANHTEAFVAGNNFSISVSPEDRTECEAQFGRISEGGTVTMPLEETFWGALFGSCTDRFGVNWMFNLELS